MHASHPRPDLRPLLGQTLVMVVDRPVGYVHHGIPYPVNYGYLPHVIGGDGEEVDVYLLGVNTPIETFRGRIIGLVLREDDMEDKLIMAPEGMTFTVREMTDAVHFQEQFFRSRIETI